MQLLVAGTANQTHDDFTIKIVWNPAEIPLDVQVLMVSCGPLSMKATHASRGCASKNDIRFGIFQVRRLSWCER